MKKLVFFFALLFLWAPLRSEETFSLQEAFILGLQHSPAIEALKGEYEGALSAVQREKGIYDWQGSAQASYRDADLTRVSVFLPSNIKEAAYGAGLDKTFSLGTRFSLSGEILRTEDNSSFSTLNKRYESALSASLTQPLFQDFLGKESRARLKGAALRFDAVKNSLLRSIEEFALDVGRRYWTLWAEIQLREVALEAQKDSLDFLNETRRLSRLGLRESDDIAQAEAAYFERQADVLEVETRIENLWRGFQTFLGAFNNENPAPLPLFPEPNENDFQDKGWNPFDLEDFRSDWRSAKQRFEANEAILKGLGTNLLPELNITGGTSLLGLDPKLSESVDDVRGADFFGWNIGMVLKHRFGQNTDRAELSLASADFYRAKAQLKDVEQRARAESISQERSFETQEKKTDLYGKVEERRKKVSQIFVRKFEQGRISTQERLRATDDYRQSRYRHRVNRSLLILSKLNLDLSRGVLLSSLVGETRDPLVILNWKP